MWLTLLIILIVICCYYKSLKTCKYWEEQGVAYEKSLPFLGNEASSVFRITPLSEIIRSMYKKFSDQRYIGFHRFSDPILIVRDLDLIKQITVKDFDVFPDRKTLVPPDIDPLWGKNLFQMTAKDGWHSMRSTLSPSFTSSKLKTMFVLMQTCADQFVDYFKNQDETHSVNIKDAFTRFSNDIIGTTAFGIECDSLKYPENEFYVMGRDAADFRQIKALKFLAYSISPTLMKLFKIKVFNNKVASFFKNIIKTTVDYRKEKNVIRPDMIHLMMEAQKSQENQSANKTNKQFTELSHESMTAQALIFFLAGFETASSAMSYVAYDLAVNPDLQQKLYEEIKESLVDEEGLTYETLFAMKYLDCFVSESMRLHPPVITLDRKSVRPYTIPPVLPSEKALYLKEGSVVWIPVNAIHLDEQYFPNPNKFDPERFNNKNKHTILPFTYFPFGSGPRNCIGSRFALLEMKMIIVKLLQNFEFVPNEKTEIPFKPSKINFNGIPDEGIWLSLKPRK